MRYSPSPKNKFYVSVGWDGKMKVWTEFFKPSSTIAAHDGPIYGLAINTNGIYIATGGKDKIVKIWKITELGQPYKEFKCDSTVNDIAFNPVIQWVAAATDTCIRVWNISGDSTNSISVIQPVDIKSKNMNKPRFLSLAWNAKGRVLYGGCSDGVIRVHMFDFVDRE